MSNNGFQARKCYDILRVRALILEKAHEQILGAAKHAYINALISSYNSTIGNSTEDARKVRCHCRKELKRFKRDLRTLPKKLYLLAVAILYVPLIYHPLYCLHVANIHRKIKKASKNIQKV